MKNRLAAAGSPASLSSEALANTYVAAAGGAALRKFSDRLADETNAKDYGDGAIGDDVTDDYVALQASLDALNDGDTWFLPSGIYATSQTLVMRARRVTVLAYGRIVPFGDFDGYLIHFVEETPGGDPLLINVGQSGTILRLELDGKWQSRGVKFTGAYCSGRSNIFITRCYGTAMWIDQGYEDSWFGVTICLGKERQRFTTPSAWSSATAYVPGDRVVYHHDAYNAGTTYGAGVLVRSSNISYMSRRSGNIGHTPASNPTWWWIVEDTFLECMIAHTNRDPFNASVYTTNNGNPASRYWKHVLQYDPVLNIENTSSSGVVDHQYFYGLDIRDNAQRYQIYVDNNGNSRAVYSVEFHGAQVHAITPGVTADPRNTGGMAVPPFIKNLILGRTVDCKGFGLSCRTAQLDDSASIMYGLNLPGKVSYGFHQNGRLDGEGARSTGVLVGAAQSVVNSLKHFFEPFFVYTHANSEDFVDPYSIVHRDLMTPLFAPNVRNKLTTTRALWVDPVDGLDTNDGLADYAPLKTLQLAVVRAANDYDLANNVIEIRLMAGTHDGVIVPRGVGAGRIKIIGYEGTLGDGACKIVGTNTDAIAASNGPQLEVLGNIQLSTTGDGACISATMGASIIFGDGLQFGDCAGSHLIASKGGTLTSSGAYYIDGDAESHIHGTGGGIIDTQNATITIRNNPAFAAYFVGLDYSFYNCVGTVWENDETVIGSKMTVHLGAIIRRGSNNPDDIPGSVDGVIRWGGWFDDKNAWPS